MLYDRQFDAQQIVACPEQYIADEYLNGNFGKWRKKLL